MIQWWTAKMTNYDKILLFKLGSFYEIFFPDAVITQRVLNLNWMGMKCKVGFPERCVQHYGSILVENGHKVAVIEQVETKI